MKIPSVEYAKKLKRQVENYDMYAMEKVIAIVNANFIPKTKTETKAMEIIDEAYALVLIYTI